MAPIRDFFMGPYRAGDGSLSTDVTASARRVSASRFWAIGLDAAHNRTRAAPVPETGRPTLININVHTADLCHQWAELHSATMASGPRVPRDERSAEASGRFMIEIRIHGRGGQGNVVAAYLLASAAFEAGLHCQAFPAFGAERRGAPVVAFVRLSNKPIRRRNEVREPTFLIVQDKSLLAQPELTAGLKPGGGILVNAGVASEALSAEHGRDMIAVPATAMALETIGRPVPNVALLSAFLTLTELLPHKALAKALVERFKGEVLERNLELIKTAAKRVPAGLWREDRRAAGA